MTNLEELHRKAYENINREDNFNYGEDVTIHWCPVARDAEFEKQIAKLKAMKAFNNRSR